MRPKLKVGAPEPTGTEYENFDRLARILIAKKPAAKKAPARTATTPKRQVRRLPRP